MSKYRELVCRPIGVVHSPFRERIEAPRQPAAGRDIRGRIELVAGRHFDHALEDLESWRFIWVIFWFHLNAEWRPKVLPPRSERRRGVFATRSPHRPNPIGMSVMKLEKVHGLTLHVRGVDLLDGTPVLDLKPYVSHADALDVEGEGWLDEHESNREFVVEFEPEAQRALEFLQVRWGVDLVEGFSRVLKAGPKPHPYRRIKPTAEGFMLALKEWRAHFQVRERTVFVTRIESGYRARDLRDDDNRALDQHRDFQRQSFGRPS